LPDSFAWFVCLNLSSHRLKKPVDDGLF